MISLHGIRLALNAEQFNSALFKPVDGGTFDGFIIRRYKRVIRLFFRGEYYTLNPHHVFCLESKLPDGRTWYSYGGKLNELTLTQLADLEDAIRGEKGESK